SQVHLVDEDTVKWTGEVPGGGVLQLISDPTDPAVFFVLTSERIFQFSTVTNQLEKIHEGRGFTCADVDARNKQLIVGTDDGYFRYGLAEGKVIGERSNKLPWAAIDVVKVLGGNYWFGTRSEERR